MEMRLTRCAGYDEIIFSDKGTSFSLAFEGVPVDYYDEAGRLLGTFDHDIRAAGGVHYRRGLDGKVLERYRTPESGRKMRAIISESRSRAIVEGPYRRARELRQALANAQSPKVRDLHINETTPGALEAFANRLETAARWTSTRLAEDATRFAEAYAPVGILPPDQYLSLVVQLTTGCSWNRCTFCEFYDSEPFHVKNPIELEEHVRRVLAFMGRSISLRRSLFLGEGNALTIPHAELLGGLDVLERYFDLSGGGSGGRVPMDGASAFLDGFSAMQDTAERFAELRARGLARIYLGLESGDDELLRFIRKPAHASGMVDAVERIKRGGLSVGVIVMVGVGGDWFARDHVRKTLRVLREMGLDRSDVVFLSDFVNHPGRPYERLARDAGIRALDGEELAAQRTTFESALKSTGWPGSPRVSRYDIREFIY